jgi:hypothetical protein
MTMTSLTGPLIKIPPWFFCDKIEVDDWRKPLVDYLHNPSSPVDRKVRRWALKFVLDDGEFYRQIADDLLLKFLGPDQARLAMAVVHEGIFGTHQSAPKMKWLLRRACFNWPTMIADCFRYYKGCEECKKYGDVQLVAAALMHPIIKPWPFQRMGSGFHWQDSSFVVKGALFCDCGY